ncbi:hypothetical protein H9L19_07965 [Weissella diestrammenae]|uniref:Mga helix-turn-helix domain-containing protein n=1 Tax=Weissella diestrammenae TaxID=1162633 RepID=A0A7G9T5B0_9LACO|nr:hypothetical protein [Weissella diestrammenae]MCM0583143.1 hypothetical protein [Weissella diestrammenae]QNN75285.1 hypothetical protein H9L19_07965 [Weissella diestrammenae]
MEYGWSESYFFTVKKQLKDFLKVNQIDFSDDISNEQKVRNVYFVYEILRSYDFNLNSWADIKTSQKIKSRAFVTYLIQNQLIDAHFERQVESMLMIIDLCQYQQIGVDELLINLDASSVWHDVAKHLEHSNSIQFIIFFLLSEDFLQIDRMNELELTSSLVNVFERVFSHMARTQLQEAQPVGKIKKQLFLILLAGYLRPNFVEYDMFQLRKRYFIDNSPVAFYIADSLREHFQIETQSTVSMRTFIRLCVLLEQNELLPEKNNISVYLSFSAGTALTEWLATQIRSFQWMDVEVTNDPNLADIILSDYMFTDETKKRTIIWLEPPTPEDWYLFGEQVIEIKKDKMTLFLQEMRENELNYEV